MLISCVAVAVGHVDVQSIPATPIVPAEVLAALDQAEKAGDGLEAFTSIIAYRKDDALLGSRELRTGRIVYAVGEGGSETLAVVFDMRVVNARREKSIKRIVFDGRWLVEADPQTKQLIKREVVEPGETIDPMRLGGPFPLPVGQPRSDVLARFDASMIDEDPEPFIVPEGTEPRPIGVRLVPKSQTPLARDWKVIDVWYDPSNWLPVGVKAVEVNGDTRRIRLTSLSRNPELDEDDRAALSTEPPAKDWALDVQPWVATP